MKPARAIRIVGDGSPPPASIKQVRAANARPAKQFAGATPEPNGKIDAKRIESITGLNAATHPSGVIKISTGRTASMHGIEIGGSIGLTSWAAFSGSDELAVMDGDFVMTADEVQPVLKALRSTGLHVVALHNHMLGEEPAFYFTHFWGKGLAADLAKSFKAALEAQTQAQKGPYPSVRPKEKSPMNRSEAEQVDVIDIAKRQQVAQVPVGKRPRGIGFLRDDSRAYVASKVASEVYGIEVPPHKALPKTRPEFLQRRCCARERQTPTAKTRAFP